MKHRTFSVLITSAIFISALLIFLTIMGPSGAATNNQNRSSRVPAQSPSPSPSTTNEQFTKPAPSIDLIRQESTRGGIGPAGVSHLSKGADEYKAGRNAAAVPELREAIRENPKSDDPHYVLALALAADGKLKEAIEEYKQVIALATKDDPKILAYFNMGNAYADLRQYPEAIESYKAAIKIDPELSKPHNNLGLAYAALKQLEPINDDLRFELKKPAQAKLPSRAGATTAKTSEFEQGKQYATREVFGDVLAQLGEQNKRSMHSMVMS